LCIHGCKDVQWCTWSRLRWWIASAETWICCLVAAWATEYHKQKKYIYIYSYLYFHIYIY
jgi:hypothetical protein